MKKIIVISFTLLFIFTNSILLSQEKKDLKSQKLHLIPYPKVCTVHNDVFKIEKNIMIILNNEKDNDDLFSARQLIDEIKRDLKFEIKIGKAKGTSTILLTRTKLIDSSDVFNTKKDVARAIGDEGYLLTIKPKTIIIAANGIKGTFYGIQTLKQIIRANRKSNTIPCIDIIDWPTIPFRGWQDDISRGPIPTLDFLKEEIRTMAEYKQNLFTLYTEHVFKLKKHPAIAPSDGITEEEIKELSAYAKKYHVELVGNFQSFGHFNNILKTPGYENLGEADWIISPAKEESYKFLSDVYSEIAPSYDSPLFNINCDETDGIGSGASKKMLDSIGLEGVYAYHINRIDKLLKPYGKILMMWGDIAVHNKKIIPQLPKDLVILSWGYDAKSNFDDAILPFKQTGFNFFVCPGVNCWSRIWPDFHEAIINISNYIRDGAKYGAGGVLNTTWDDSGDNLFNYNWYPLIWGADCAWSPALPEKNDQNYDSLRNSKLEKFNLAFEPIFFSTQDSGITKAMNKLSDLRNYKQTGSMYEGKFLTKIQLSPYLNLNDKEIKESDLIIKESDKIINDLKKSRNKVSLNKDKLDFAILAAEKINFAIKRDLIQNKISMFLSQPDSRKSNINFGLSEMQKELSTLKTEYTKLWNAENRKWYLDKIQTRYDNIIQDLQEKEYEVIINPSAKIINKSRSISFSNLAGKGEIYYTTDGTDPNLSSSKYTEPFIINKTTVIKAAPVIKNKIGKSTVKEVSMTPSFGKNVVLKNPFNYKYSAGSPNALTDGEKGSLRHSDGHWQGFEGDDLDATIDLEESTPVNKISVNFLHDAGAWIFLPAKVEFEISEDGINFKNVYSESFDTPGKDVQKFIKNISIDLKDIKTRYIRVKAKNIGKCPEWHSGANGKAWIFTDEITIQ
jgi:hexosaminidase